MLGLTARAMRAHLLPHMNLAKCQTKRLHTKLCRLVIVSDYGQPGEVNQSKKQQVQQAADSYRGMSPATAPLGAGGAPVADRIAARTC